MNHKLYIPIVIVILFMLSSCKTVTIKSARQQYIQGEYYEASTSYRKAIGRIPSKNKDQKAEAYFEMGRCYQLSNQMTRAESAYNFAIRGKYGSPELYLRMAQVKHKIGRYKEATDNYKKYLEQNPSDEVAINGLMASESAANWRANPTRYVVKPATRLNNNGGSDFSAAFANKEGDQLIFTSTRRQVKGKDKSLITGQKSGDLFFSKKDKRGHWEAPKPLEGEVNSDHDEGVPTLSIEGSTLYFTRCRNREESVTEILKAQKSEVEWGVPQLFKITKDSLTAVAHPSLSPQGDWLYFVSDMQGGIGGLDIWRARLSGGSVEYIENLGDTINTAGNEMFPFIREDGVLFFASDGHPGFGGLDIFKATPTEDESWFVSNMGFPINSPSDDFGIVYLNLEEKGFISSNRGSTRGYDKLFTFELPELKCFVEGSVRDDRKNPLREARINIVGDNGFYQKLPVKTDGTYRFRLEPGVRYAIQATSRGYLNVADYFDVPSEEKDWMFKKDFTLMQIARTIRVENVFFDHNMSTLKPESDKALMELIEVLNQNPNITIELSSHTDYTGSDLYNQNLSDRRAKTVVDYLISNGVDPLRLTPKGYGESSPVGVSEELNERFDFLPIGEILTEEFILSLTPEQQEIAKALNRRTEFRVLRTDFNLF
ncbi:MAG: OmpA family protein [Bacteroidales bacterium]